MEEVKFCKNCPEMDYNFQSDEAYCTLKDLEEIKLRKGQGRPEWCPKRNCRRNRERTNNIE